MEGTITRGNITLEICLS